MRFSWDYFEGINKFFANLHFTELENNLSRQFNISMNGELWYDINVVRKLFDEIAERNLANWNAMIAGSAYFDLDEEGLECFLRSRREGLRPDESASKEIDYGGESISQRSAILDGGTEDQLSLKDSLAAARNAVQAAARIQAAFRSYSFRKKQQKAALYQGGGILFPP